MPNAYADLTTLKSASYLNIPSLDTGHDTYLRILLESASREIDNFCHRFFYVLSATRYFDGKGESILLDDILSATTLKTDEDGDGTYEESWTVNEDYELYPLNGYPKTWAEISSRASREYASFNKGVKKGVQIAGSFGYGDGESATPYLASGAVVNTGGITNSATTHALATGKGASFGVYQTILIGTEQLYITSVWTDTLTFERAKNGTAAAAHTAADVIYIYQYPLPIKQACLIQAMRWWKRKDSAFQNVVGIAETGEVARYFGLDPEVALIIKQYMRYQF